MKEKKKVWFLDVLIQSHRELLNGGGKRNGKKRAGNVRSMRQKMERGSSKDDSVQYPDIDRGLLCSKSGSSVR